MIPGDRFNAGVAQAGIRIEKTFYMIGASDENVDSKSDAKQRQSLWKGSKVRVADFQVLHFYWQGENVGSIRFSGDENNVIVIFELMSDNRYHTFNAADCKDVAIDQNPSFSFCIEFADLGQQFGKILPGPL